MLKVYAYQGCSTCKNAMKWLKARVIAYQELAIRETPPSVKELRAMLKAQGGEMRLLFNTSGQDYRAQGLKDTLPKMSEDEALKLLSENGNLVKRPFVLDEARGIALVGFKENAWAKAFEV
jgi:arsenate reductase (glutaredoxin)